MSDEDKHSKTEQPTSKKLEEAKKKGVPHSRDLTSTVTLIASVIALYSTGGFMFSTLKRTSYEILSSMGTYQLTESSVYKLLLKMLLVMLSVTLPFMVVVVIAGTVTTLLQVGFSLQGERITFDLTKLDPVKNFNKLFNKDSLVEMVKALLKMAIVGYMAYKILRDEMDSIVYLTETDLTGILEFVKQISFKLVLHTCGVLLILATLDLAFVKWRFIQNLKMTKQEVKDEHKESEGDPQVKGKIRRMQFEQAQRRLRKIIPTADVIVTNPTHFAVALKYDRMTMTAPVVLAKGADYMAQQIKAIAKENSVMLVENRFLARELYAQVKEGQEVPEALYTAVAEVLAYVYSLKGKI
ncbi:flagellar biosynthesis protein FlhB [Geotalea uraniireducens]|uniref:Flagellar biosynthetic protein FlhB n=1 Tax=Geotalea uraniireducens TaxID=351604 RepID=A0ABM8EGD1_9BACT|nr:flagellar biosynthesis protein FlhB [Geotalea uraniireducens]BDV41465.1 flagellar biosynthesis protein FlhB [Geotalea uraniireducens]